MEPLTLEARLERGETDETLCRLYGAEHLEAARERCKQVFAGFRKAFGSEPSARNWAATTPTTNTAGFWPQAWIWTSWPPPHPTPTA